MDLQVTPSQRQYADAHKKRLADMWPAQTPKAKVKKPIFSGLPPLPPEPAMTAEEWFASAWNMLDGPLIRRSIREIQEMACEHFGVPYLYMESSRRNQAYYLPRATAIYLCNKFTGQSHPAIARLFGNRDPSTIIYCVRSVEKMIALNHPIAEDIKLLSAKLEGANQ